MPEERIYQPRVDQAAAGTTPLLRAQATPDMFGGGLANGLQELGGAIGKVGDAIERRAEDEELADFNHRFAVARTESDKAITDARSNAAPGAAGHSDTIKAAWEEKRKTLSEGIRTRRVQLLAQQQLDAFGESLFDREYKYEQGIRIGKMAGDQEAASDIGANRARLSPNPDAFAQELAAGHSSIAALQGVPDDVKEKLTRYHDQRVTIGYLNGLSDTNPQMALATLDAGTFNEILSPEQIDAARNGAQVEIRRVQAVAEHQAAVDKADTREQIQTVTAQINAGIAVDPGIITGLASKATRYGDSSAAFSLQVLGERARIGKVTQTWTPAQWDAAIQELTVKKSKSPADQVQLQALEEGRSAALSVFNNQPHLWAARIGRPAPALDMTPNSLKARLAWSRSVSAAAGKSIPPLNAGELQALHDDAAGSAAGLVRVAAQLAPVGGRDAQALARQVMPQDATLSRLVLLDESFRNAYVRGAQVRNGNRALIDGASATQARTAFNDAVGTAGMLFDNGDTNAAFEVARNLFADFQARQGAFEWDDTKGETDFKPWVNIALGGKKGDDGYWRGGVGRWNEQPILLPDGVTQGRFDRVLSRLQFKPDNGPAYRDGKPMSAAQLRGFIPVRRPDGRYEFRSSANEWVPSTKGGRFVVDIAKLAKDSRL